MKAQVITNNESGNKKNEVEKTLVEKRLKVVKRLKRKKHLKLVKKAVFYP
jgi:hypothetical protein